MNAISHEFVLVADPNTPSAYDNVLIACPGEHHSDSRKQHTALLLSGEQLDSVERFGTKALERARELGNVATHSIP